MNLRVIARGFEFAIPFDQSRFQLRRGVQGFRNNWRTDFSNRRVQRIEKQQIQSRQQLFQQCTKSPAHGDAGGIRVPHHRHDFLAMRKPSERS